MSHIGSAGCQTGLAVQTSPERPPARLARPDGRVSASLLLRFVDALRCFAPPILGGLSVLLMLAAGLGDGWGAERPGGSWPLWGGSPRRNAVNLIDRNIPTDWVIPRNPGDKSQNVKWSVDLGTRASGSVVVSGGKIFVGTNNQRPRNPDLEGDKGILMCFREADGQFLWQAVHDKLATGRVQDWPEDGVLSHPVVEGNRIWYVSNRCEVICATTEGLKAGNVGVKDEKYTSNLDADIVWRLDMIGQLGVFPHNRSTCSPLLVGNTLFVVTGNGVDEGHVHIPSPKAPSFLALDKNTGKVLWQDNSPGRNILHGQWSSPVYADIKGAPQVIFPGGDGWLRAFEPDTGKLIWKFDCNPKAARARARALDSKSSFLATPVLADNKLYVGVGQDPEYGVGVGHLWCIDITKQPANKDKDLSPFSGPKDRNPDFDPRDPRNRDSGLVWHFGGFDFDPARVRGWHFGRTLSNCIVHEGLCYACDLDGYFYCLDALTGKRLWQHNLGCPILASPCLVDGHIYIGGENGVIHIFRHGGVKQLVNTVRMGRAGFVRRGAPVVCNGVLYIVTENPCRLWAIGR
jgi:outer membrane protein assembly factor BamB